MEARHGAPAFFRAVAVGTGGGSVAATKDVGTALASSPASAPRLSIHKKAAEYRVAKAKRTAKTATEGLPPSATAPAPGWRWWVAARAGGGGNVAIALLLRAPAAMPTAEVVAYCRHLPTQFGAQ